MGGVKAVETEVGAMVADWGEVAMAAWERAVGLVVAATAVAKVEEEKAAAKVAFVEVLVVVA